MPQRSTQNTYREEWVSPEIFSDITKRTLLGDGILTCELLFFFPDKNIRNMFPCIGSNHDRLLEPHQFPRKPHDRRRLGRKTCVPTPLRKVASADPP